MLFHLLLNVIIEEDRDCHVISQNFVFFKSRIVDWEGKNTKIIIFSIKAIFSFFSVSEAMKKWTPHTGLVLFF